MNLARDDLIECVERRRFVVEPKRLHDGTPATHHVLADDYERHIANGGRVQQCAPGESGDGYLRAVKSNLRGSDDNSVRRWERDTRKPMPHGQGLGSHWRGSGCLILDGTNHTALPQTLKRGLRLRKEAKSRLDADPRWQNAQVGDEFLVAGKPRAWMQSQRRRAQLYLGRVYSLSKTDGGYVVRRLA